MRFPTAVRMLAFVCAASAPLPAQLTLAQAVEEALRNYPSVRVSEEQVNAAAAGISLARTAYLPHVDVVAQVNRCPPETTFSGCCCSTQGVIPSMSGPVIGSNKFGTAWGSAVGGLVTWEPFDFGLRGANLAAAAAARVQTEATHGSVLSSSVAVAAADAYLTLAAAQETVRAAQAGVDRGETILRTIQALVNAELRPGADRSRAEAELAAARTQWIQAEQATDVWRARRFSQFVGIDDPARIAISPRRRCCSCRLEQERRAAGYCRASHGGRADGCRYTGAGTTPRAGAFVFPALLSSRRGIRARHRRGNRRQICWVALTDSAPNVQDYAVGFTVSFPVADLPAVQAREAAQSAEVRAQAARSQQIATDLRAQWNMAVATARGARRIAANTPVQVSAARAAAEQATARYKSGLGNIDVSRRSG